MKHFIFSPLLLSFICTHAMNTDDGVPTWKQVGDDLGEEIYKPCNRNQFALRLFGPNQTCYKQKLDQYIKKHEDAIKCACAKLHGEENLKVKVVDKPVVDVTLEEFKKSLNEPMHIPQATPQIESKEFQAFLECVRRKNDLLSYRVTHTFNRDVKNSD